MEKGTAEDRVSVPKHTGHATRVAVGRIQGGCDPLSDSSKQETERGNYACKCAPCVLIQITQRPKPSFYGSATLICK